jgi:hypothetical protein
MPPLLPDAPLAHLNFLIPPEPSIITPSFGWIERYEINSLLSEEDNNLCAFLIKGGVSATVLNYRDSHHLVKGFHHWEEQWLFF